jgi:ABC-type phosphate transport system substrate-binding protein
MKKERIKEYNRLNFTIKFCLIGLLLFLGTEVTAQVSPLTVISNENGSPSSLKFSELKSIFMGEQQRWRNGTRITIALMKTNTSAGKTTSKKVYGMSSDELNKFWLALVFQGKAAAPNFFNSAVDLENFVAQNPGAIGILDEVDANNDIKTIIVEGKKSL